MTYQLTAEKLISYIPNIQEKISIQCESKKYLQGLHEHCSTYIHVLYQVYIGF